jgi:hypothetical protein
LLVVDLCVLVVLLLELAAMPELVVVVESCDDFSVVDVG